MEDVTTTPLPAWQPGSKGSAVLLDYDLNASELISFLLEYEAIKLGLGVTRLSSLLVIFRDERAETIMHRACARGISRTAYRVTRDKSLTKLIFDGAGIATNRYLELQPSQLSEALAFARAINFEVVIKPTNGVQGRGVFTRIRDETSFRYCWEELQRILKEDNQSSVLIEERFVGEDFRFFVVNRRVVAVLERRPANLVGDGQSTISQLVDAKNDLRRKNPDLRDRLMNIDDIVLENLRTLNLTVETILPPNTEIVLRDNANVSTGGDSIDRTDEVPQGVKELVQQAVSAVPDLYTCGVDVLAKNVYDDTRLDRENIVFNELEGDAAMGMHHFPGYGAPRNVARTILLTQFPHRAEFSDGDIDYYHDFDDSEPLCRRIAEGIINLRGPGIASAGRASKRSQPLRSLGPMKLAEIVEGEWIKMPSPGWRFRQISFQASIKRHSLLIPDKLSYYYGIDISRIDPSVLHTSTLLVDDRFRQASPLPQLKVQSIRQAVQRLATRIRRDYPGTVCAVTGSVGKSSTCTLLHQAISRQGSCAIPQFGYNVFDGVNTQIANLTDERFAVIEIALSALPRVSSIVRPHLALLTAVAPAHLESAGNLSELAERKASIFLGLEPGGMAVINRSIPFYEHVADIARRHAHQIVPYGDHPEAVVRLLHYSLEHQHVTASVFGEVIEYPLGMNGRHMAVNSLGALAAIHAMGLDWRKAVAEFGFAQLPRGRGRRYPIRIAGKQILLIDDAYNANPTSMSAAISLLGEYRSHPGGRRIAVLADMLELGAEAPRFHAALAELLVQAKVDKAYLVGALMTYLWDALPPSLRGKKLESVNGLLPVLQSEITDGDVVLFKGSNASNLFTAVRALRDMDENRVANGPAGFPKGGVIKSLRRRVSDLFSPSVDRTSGRSGPSTARVKGSYTLTLCGDTSLGDYYLSESRDRQATYRRLCKAPASFFREVKPLIAGSDDVIANIETCLVRGMQSPFVGKKSYLGWDDPERAGRTLSEIGVTAANLANNHTMDFGAEGLLQTIDTLKTSGISVFGAGNNSRAASKPFRRRINVNHQSNSVYVIGAFAGSRKYRNTYQYYANASKTGVNLLSPRRLVSRLERLRGENPTALIIACLHWHGNYVWATDAELELSTRLASSGADLVVCHGAHMLQQCFSTEAGTVLSLGNFVFNSPGRYDKFSAPPVSLVARIEIGPQGNSWFSSLKLYPILTDNLRTDFNVQPVDRAMLSSTFSILAEHAPDPVAFRASFEKAEDERGLHIKLTNSLSPRFEVGVG